MSHIIVPKSEFRRRYLKTIVRYFQTHGGMEPAEARKAAIAMISFMQTQVFYGLPVDLGFMKVKAIVRKPVSFRNNLRGRGQASPLVCLGERVEWKAKVMGGWIRRRRPDWAIT